MPVNIQETMSLLAALTHPSILHNIMQNGYYTVDVAEWDGIVNPSERRVADKVTAMWDRLEVQQIKRVKTKGEAPQRHKEVSFPVRVAIADNNGHLIHDKGYTPPKIIRPNYMQRQAREHMIDIFNNCEQLNEDTKIEVMRDEVANYAAVCGSSPAKDRVNLEKIIVASGETSENKSWPSHIPNDSMLGMAINNIDPKLKAYNGVNFHGMMNQYGKNNLDSCASSLIWEQDHSGRIKLMFCWLITDVLTTGLPHPSSNIIPFEVATMLAVRFAMKYRKEWLSGDKLTNEQLKHLCETDIDKYSFAEAWARMTNHCAAKITTRRNLSEPRTRAMALLEIN